MSKALVGAFNQEKALVGAFSMITNLRMGLFQALLRGAHQRKWEWEVDGEVHSKVLDGHAVQSRRESRIHLHEERALHPTTSNLRYI